MQRLDDFDRRFLSLDLPLYDSTGKIIATVSDLEAGAIMKFTRSGRHGVVTVNDDINLYISGGGAVIGVNTTIDGGFAYGFTILKWRLVVVDNVSDSATVDVLTSPDSSSPSFTSIVGAGTKPSVAATINSQLQTPSGWTTTSVAAGAILQAKVTSAPTNAKGLLLHLQIQRS